MDFVTWILTLIAPLTAGQRHALIARILAGMVADRFQRTVREAEALTGPAARNALLHRHCQAHHMMLRVAEQHAGIALWLTARASCGAAHLRAQLHPPAISTSVPPGTILRRLEALARRLDSVEEEAAQLAAEWRAANSPLAHASKDTRAIAPALRAGEENRPANAAKRLVAPKQSESGRGPSALSTGPPQSQPSQTHSRASQAPAREIADACVPAARTSSVEKRTAPHHHAKANRDDSAAFSR